MRFWTFQLGQRADDTQSFRDIYQELVDDAILAEELGFDGVWTPEHHFSNYCSIPSPMVLLAAIAQRTERIRIGAMGVVVPLHNPVRVAEEVAMVDNLSKGRLEMGFARGYAGYEFEVLGASLETSKTAMAEGLEVMYKLWGGRDVSHRGLLSSFPSATISPQPWQLPHPQFWYPCGSRASIELGLSLGMHVICAVGLKGMGYVEGFRQAYLEGCAALELDPGAQRFGAQCVCYVSNEEDEVAFAIEQARFMYRIGARISRNEQRMIQGGLVDASGTEPAADGPFETWASGALVGDEEHTVKTVAELEALGVTDLSLNFGFGRLSAADRRASMTRFAELFELAGHH